MESANTVGYSAINDGGNQNPGIGGLFIPVNGSSTYKLTDITVSGPTADDFMVPGIEYLQMLNPNGSAVIARYTYVSEAFLKDEFEDDWEDYQWAIGWWNNVRGIAGLIEDGDADNKLSRGDVSLAPGATFLGKLGGNGLDFNFPAAVQ